MRNPDSVLEKIIQNVYQSNNLETSRQEMIEFLEARERMNKIDRYKMIEECKNIKTLSRLQFYITNAMFKFEGLGVS
jgi:hypothetical protein